MSDEKIDEIIKSVQSTLSFENQNLTKEEIEALKRNIEKNYERINSMKTGEKNDSWEKHK